MTSNNTLQRNRYHRGPPVLAVDGALARAELAVCPSAELGR